MRAIDRDLAQLRLKRMEEAQWIPLPPLPDPAHFTPKYNLPLLKDYSLPVYPATYWTKWTKRTLEQVLPDRSWVSVPALRELAHRADFPHTSMLERVRSTLEGGADIECEG